MGDAIYIGKEELRETNNKITYLNYMNEKRVMRTTIQAMCQKRDDLDKRFNECRSHLYQNCLAVQFIPDKI